MRILARVVLALVILPLFLCCFLGFDTPELGSAAAEAALPTIRCINDGRTVTLVVDLPRDASACGFFAEIFYCGDRLSLRHVSPVGDAGRGGYVSFADTGESVRIIGDGYTESFEGEIFRADFERREEFLGDVGISLVTLSLYFRSDGRLCERRYCYSDKDIVTEKVKEKNVIAYSHMELGEDGVISVSGSVKKSCFAVGTDIALIDLLPGRISPWSELAAVLPHGGELAFEREVYLPTEGRFCVIVRPVAYSRDRVDFGEGWIFVLVDGELFGDITNFGG